MSDADLKTAELEEQNNLLRRALEHLLKDVENDVKPDALTTAALEAAGYEAERIIKTVSTPGEVTMPCADEDEPLLRFTIYRWEGFPIGDWEAIEDASYCTRNTVATPRADLEKMGQELIYEARRAGTNSCKKAMEAGSWITP